MKRIYFQVGERVGNVEIVAVPDPSISVDDAVYRVRRLCCGEETTLTRAVLRVRRRDGRALCRSCARHRYLAEGRVEPVASTVARVREAEAEAPRDAVLAMALGAWR